MIAKLIDKLLNYIPTKLDVLKLSLIERVAVIMGYCVFIMVAMIVTSAAIVFLGMGLAEYFTVLTGSAPLGYLIVTGIYLLLLLLLFACKKSLHKWFANLFVNLLTTYDDEADDKDNVNGH